jgi:hypothetical protein
MGPSNSTQTVESRSPIAIRFLYGPDPNGPNPPEDQYQFKICGNVVSQNEDSWPSQAAVTTQRDGCDFRAGSDGLFQNNGFFNTGGCGISLVTGGEARNLIDSNFICMCHGDGTWLDTEWEAGSGIWIHGPGPANRITNNVMACCRSINFPDSTFPYYRFNDFAKTYGLIHSNASTWTGLSDQAFYRLHQ